MEVFLCMFLINLVKGFGAKLMFYFVHTQFLVLFAEIIVGVTA